MNYLWIVAATLVSVIKCASDLIIIKDLPLKSYEVDQLIKIQWTVKSASSNSSMITIDLVNDRPEVLLEPFLIGQHILAHQEEFEWKIPRFMKSAGDYHFRVYPGGDVSQMSMGKAFSLTNPNPGRQSTLHLLEPTGSADGSNLESTCLLGEKCTILWDYPDWAATAMPKLIDIKLFADDKLMLIIASNVPVEQKTFVWQVPTDAYLKSVNVHAVIMASGKKLPTIQTGSSYYLASSGYPFQLESRAEREERRLNAGKPMDFTAPGPIQVIEQPVPGSSGLIDVPRPTYKADGPAAVKVTMDSSSAKIAINFNGLIMIALASSILLFIF